MKKILFALSLFVFCSLSFAQIGSQFFTLTPAVTTLATVSTNGTLGTVKELIKGENPLYISVSCNGNASSAGAITLRFSIATGSSGVTNGFCDASAAPISVVVSNALTSATTTACGQFNVGGARYIAVSSIENTKNGSVSNIVINVGYPVTKGY